MRERPEMLLTLARSRDPKKRIVTCAQAAAALGMSLDRFDREIRGAPGSGGEGVGLRPATMHAGRPSYDAGYLHQRFTQLGLWGWRAREEAALAAAREEAAAEKDARRAARAEARRLGAERAALRRAGGDPAACSGETAAAVYALLEAGADAARIVIEARAHPAAVDDLRRRRDAARGAVTLTAADLATLRAAGVRIDAADGAAAAASIVKATRCVECDRSRAIACESCIDDIEGGRPVETIDERRERRRDVG